MKSCMKFICLWVKFLISLHKHDEITNKQSVFISNTKRNSHHFCLLFHQNVVFNMKKGSCKIQRMALTAERQFLNNEKRFNI